MKKLLIIAMLLSTPAMAQEVNLKITTQEADIVWSGLRKLPVETVESLMQKIRQQVQEQTQPKPAERSIAPSESGGGSGRGGSPGYDNPANFEKKD